MPDDRDGVAAALPALRTLLAGAAVWSAGGTVDLAGLAAVRTRALLDNHARYAGAVPAYAGLAAEHLGGRAATLADLRGGLLVSEDFFKSYDPAWLRGDLPALTRWLARISTLRVTAPDAADGGPRDLTGWRAAMKAAGAYVTFSSGTGGTPSLVPRDRLTLAALRAAGGVRQSWAPRPHGYDCLLLTRPGITTGIQSGAAGLASRAVRVHHLWPPPAASPVEGDRPESRPPEGGGGPESRPPEGGGGPESRPDDDGPTRDHHRAGEHPPGDRLDPAGVTGFLRTAVDAGRPVVVYGAPAGLADLLGLLGPEPIGLPPGSCVVTGGGWKAAAAGDLWELLDRTGDRLGVPADRRVDTYSSAELNTVLVSCVRRRYHVPPVVEALVLDADFQPVDVDEAGEADGRLAVLDPFAMSYPGFIATGDRATLRHDPCGCGLSGPTLLGPIRRLATSAARGCGVGTPG